MHLKIFSLITLLLVFSMGSKAQHCAFDMAYIMVLQITDAENKPITENIEVVLLNPKGIYHKLNHNKSIVSEKKVNLHKNGYRFTGSINDTLGLNGGYNHKYYFFANQNFVHVVPKPVAKAKILIKSTNGAFNNLQIEIAPDYYFPLCTEYSSWTDKENPRFVSGFKPFMIRLDIKKNLTPRFFKGQYLLPNQPGTSAEYCKFSKIILTRSGKFRMLDNELPVNDMEIRNINKSSGFFEIVNDSTLVFNHNKQVYWYTKYKRPWFIKTFHFYRKKKNLQTYSETYYYKDNCLYPEMYQMHKRCYFKRK